MIRYRESRISAHHNYLVNDMLTPGFVVGNPREGRGFYFLADIVLAGESTPRISARLMDEEGRFLAELSWNRFVDNPGGCAYQAIFGGFRIQPSSGEPLLEVRTQTFPRGYLTRIKARLFDEQGKPRMEPLGESIQIHGEANLFLERPFVFSNGIR